MSITLNASSVPTTSARKLDGPDRTLDALIGTIVFAAGLTIVMLGISELYRIGTAIVERSGFSEEAEIGFVMAVGGTILFGGIAGLTFLIRLARGHRSWRAPLWGTILASVAQLLGFLIMTLAL